MAYDVVIAPVPPGEVGRAYWGDCVVAVDPIVLDPDTYSTQYAVAVLAHEYWHAAGWEDHLDGYSATPIAVNHPAQGDPPTTEEVARMQTVSHQVLLTVRDAPLLFPADAAAQAWNGAIGREVFVVIDGTH